MHTQDYVSVAGICFSCYFQFNIGSVKLSLHVQIGKECSTQNSKENKIQFPHPTPHISSLTSQLLQPKKKMAKSELTL